MHSTHTSKIHNSFQSKLLRRSPEIFGSFSGWLDKCKKNSKITADGFSSVERLLRFFLTMVFFAVTSCEVLGFILGFILFIQDILQFFLQLSYYVLSAAIRVFKLANFPNVSLLAEAEVLS
jgi:hypothetical protein